MQGLCGCSLRFLVRILKSLDVLILESLEVPRAASASVIYYFNSRALIISRGRRRGEREEGMPAGRSSEAPIHLAVILMSRLTSPDLTDRPSTVSSLLPHLLPRPSSLLSPLWVFLLDFDITEYSPSLNADIQIGIKMYV